MKKTLPRASGIWEANRTKPRQKNVGSIFKTSFLRLRKNVLVFFFYIPAKNCNDDVNEGQSCDIRSKFKLSSVFKYASSTESSLINYYRLLQLKWSPVLWLEH